MNNIHSTPTGSGRSPVRFALITLAVVSCAFALRGEAAPSLRTPEARKYVMNKRVCVSRDTTTLPGYVIATWHKGGKLDSIVTNKLHSISGREQTSPLIADAKATREIRKAAKRAEKNLSKIVKTIEQAKKKAGDEDEAALYQSLLDLLTNLSKEAN